jgi:hypothetical protein
MHYWEIIADKLHGDGWSWGCCTAFTREKKLMFIIDAHSGDGRRFIVHSDEKLTAFLEIGRVVRTATDSPTAT